MADRLRYRPICIPFQIYTRKALPAISCLMCVRPALSEHVPGFRHPYLFAPVMLNVYMV